MFKYGGQLLNRSKRDRLNLIKISCLEINLCSQLAVTRHFSTIVKVLLFYSKFARVKCIIYGGKLSLQETLFSS